MVRLTVGFIAGFAVAVGLAFASQPHCPTEDSCSPDYVHTWHGGIWTGKEVKP
jgi:hypothetical protein